MKSWNVAKEESGLKLISFLKEKLKERFSLKQLKRGIEHQLCQINGKCERFASTLIASGDCISFRDELCTISQPSALHFEKKRVLYEDENLLIYNKPAGIACDRIGLEALIRPKVPNAELTHRLDKDTTGIVIFSKNLKSHEQMLSLFKKRQVQKEYLALVEGVPKSQEGVIQNRLGKIRTWQGQSFWGEDKTGLYAETSWRCERRGKKISLMRCFPKTGRTHQIRVHLSSIGLPILGDPLYNPKSSILTLRCMLHAGQVSFLYKGQILEIDSPLPDDMKKCIQECL